MCCAATTPRCPFTGESETDTTRNAIPHTHQKSQMKFVIANYTYVWKTIQIPFASKQHWTLALLVRQIGGFTLIPCTVCGSSYQKLDYLSILAWQVEHIHIFFRWSVTLNFHQLRDTLTHGLPTNSHHKRKQIPCHHWSCWSESKVQLQFCPLLWHTVWHFPSQMFVLYL